MGIFGVASSTTNAPGPAGHWLWGHLSAIRGDELGLVLESARAYGDVVRFRLGPVVFHLLNHPDHVEHVLVRRAQNYRREGRSAGFLREVCGTSLLTGDGSLWREHRRLMQPAFVSRTVATLAGVMARSVAELLVRWESWARQGATVDVAAEMNRTAFIIAGRGLFGEEVGPEAGVVESALTEVLAQTFKRVQSLWSCPRWWPTLENRRFKTAIREMDRVVYRIIEHRRQEEGERADLLSLLMKAGSETLRNGFSNADLRNEAITLLLAGHETTANALAWTFHLLAEHVEAQRQVREEAGRVLGEQEAPGAEDLARLPFTTAVLQESMRLYPPIWILERQVTAADEIGGFRIPARSSVVVSPWALHRHPGFWEAPEEFRPDRFTRAPVTNSYLPFGLGPHQCIGQHFALFEARTLLAMVARRFRWEKVAGQVIRPKGGITLRQEPGLRVKLFVA